MAIIYFSGMHTFPSEIARFGKYLPLYRSHLFGKQIHSPKKWILSKEASAWKDIGGHSLQHSSPEVQRVYGLPD